MEHNTIGKRILKGREVDKTASLPCFFLKWKNKFSLFFVKFFKIYWQSQFISL